MEVFDFIPLTSFDGAMNIAIDESLFISVLNNTRNNVIRLYTWNNPAITIGCYQKISDLNIERCKENNITIIRRITGGRAVLHYSEITYLFVVKANENVNDFLSISNRKKIFKEISEIVLAGLRCVGITCFVSEFKGKHYQRNINCFKSVSEYEIVDNYGFKIAGSAMKIKNNIIFLEGSIPLLDYSNCFDELTQKDFYKKTGKIIFQKCSEDKFNNFYENLLCGISKKVKLNYSSLTSEELDRAVKLNNEKYLNYEYINKF